MKIIEGTAEEILEYQSKVKTNNPFVPMTKKTEIPPVVTAEAKRILLKNRERSHWSRTKGQFISIEGMNASYIMNVLKHKLEDNTNKELIEDDDEFVSLVLSLGDKLVEEKL